MINNKEKYIKDVENRFSGRTKDILIDHINLFYEEHDNPISDYSIGDKVYLKKGTFIHGIGGELDSFKYCMNNGFISSDFTDTPRPNKICNSVGVWNIKSDILLGDYIKLYSGITLSFRVGRGPESLIKTRMVPYHEFDKITEEINNDESIWSYEGEQTKEVRFMPSLVANKRQIAFIFNMDSSYAKKLAKNDVWDITLDKETVAPFLDYRYVDKFVDVDRVNRNDITTDRESAIMFGIPTNLIEGVLVGRKIEQDNEALEYIKKELPNTYICNLEGIVIK